MKYNIFSNRNPFVNINIIKFNIYKINLIDTLMLIKPITVSAVGKQITMDKESSINSVR